MPEYGYFLAIEEFGPAELIEQAVGVPPGSSEVESWGRRSRPDSTVCGSLTTSTRGTTPRAGARSCGR